MEIVVNVVIVAIVVNVVIDVSVMIFEIVVNVKYVAKCCKCCKIRFVGHVCVLFPPSSAVQGIKSVLFLCVSVCSSVC